MVFDKSEIDAIKRYCEKVFLLEEAGVTFLQLQRLRLPEGCTPENTRCGPEYWTALCSDMRRDLSALAAGRNTRRALLAPQGALDLAQRHGPQRKCSDSI